MVTKQDVDNILKQVNAILQGFDDRIRTLEDANKNQLSQKIQKVKQKT